MVVETIFDRFLGSSTLPDLTLNLKIFKLYNTLQNKNENKLISFQSMGLKSSHKYDKYDKDENPENFPSNQLSDSKSNIELKTESKEFFYSDPLENNHKFLPSYIRHPSWNGKDYSKPSSKETDSSQNTFKTTDDSSQNIFETADSDGLLERLNE